VYVPKCLIGMKQRGEWVECTGNSAQIVVTRKLLSGRKKKNHKLLASATQGNFTTIDGPMKKKKIRVGQEL